MSDVILQAVDVTKRFGSFAALEGVTLSVQRSAVHGIIGPNGAGKTTLFNVLTGETVPTTGEVRLEGRTITTLKSFERVQLGMARSFQITSLFQNLSVFENVRLGTQAMNRRASYDFLTGVARHRDCSEAAWRVLERVGMGHLADVRAGELSHGWQRVLEVALALSSCPRLLLLDEPTAGMGVEDLDRMRALLLDLAKDYTIVLIEHNVRLVMDICRTVTVLDHGKVLVEGLPDAVSRDPRVREAYLGVGI